jgi:hypothetical protein
MKPKIIEVHSISGQQQAFEVKYPEGMSKVYFVTSTGISHHTDVTNIKKILKYSIGFNGYLEIEAQALNTLDMLLKCKGLEPWMRNQLLSKSKTWGMIPSIRDNPIDIKPIKITEKRQTKILNKEEINYKKIRRLMDSMKEYCDDSFDVDIETLISTPDHLSKNQFGYVKRKYRF